MRKPCAAIVILIIAAGWLLGLLPDAASQTRSRDPDVLMTQPRVWGLHSTTLTPPLDKISGAAIIHTQQVVSMPPQPIQSNARESKPEATVPASTSRQAEETVAPASCEELPQVQPPALAQLTLHQGAVRFLGNGVPGPHRYSVGREVKDFPRSRPSLDPPFTAAQLCNLLNASVRTCETAFDFTPYVDTLCLVDFAGAFNIERLEGLAALDANIVVTGFLVNKRDDGAGNASDRGHFAVEDIRHPRFRTISASSVSTLGTAIDELAVVQAGWGHCRMTLLLNGEEPHVASADKHRVVESISTLVPYSNAVLLDLCDSARLNASHLGLVAINGSERVFDASRCLLNYNGNIGMAMGVKDVIEGSWRRINLTHVLPAAIRDRITGNASVSGTLKRFAAESKTSESSRDLVSQLMAGFSAIGNASTICIVGPATAEALPLKWILRHPTAQFHFLERSATRPSCCGEADAIEIGGIFVTHWCGASSGHITAPQTMAERVSCKVSTTAFVASASCQVVVIDASVSPEQLASDVAVCREVMDPDFNVMVVVGSQASRVKDLADVHVLKSYGHPLNATISQLHLTSGGKVHGSLATVSVSTPSSAYEAHAARGACAPFDHDVMSGGPVYDAEHDWHQKILWHDHHNIEPIKMDMLHLANTSVKLREYYSDVSWPRDTQKHLEINGPIAWSTVIDWLSQSTLAMDVARREIIDIASAVLTSGRYWGAGPHITQLGQWMSHIPRDLDNRAEAPDHVIPASPSLRYYWAGGMHSQGFHSHGLEELLNHFGRYWAICRGEEACVRGTPMVLPNLTSEAFVSNMAFFRRVLPEIPMIFFPIKQVIASPNGSSMMFALPEMTPPQMPARASFVSRILWPRVQQYIQRHLPDVVSHRPERVAVMKVPRQSSVTPERSFNLSPGFKEQLARLGFFWLEDDAPKELRAWYVGHASVVLTTWGSTRAIMQELFPGEWRSGRLLRLVILQHTSYDNEVWYSETERATQTQNASLTRFIYTTVRSHNIREKVIRLPNDDVAALSDGDVMELF